MTREGSTVDLLPTLIGALPDLGAAGIVLVILVIGGRMVAQERAHFTAERTAYRLEATEDRKAAAEELSAVKAERDALQARLAVLLGQRQADPPGDEQWRPRL